jgi:hypothetical protein
MSYGKKDDIHRTPDVSHIQNEDVAHEESDVNVKAVSTFVVGLFILIVVSMILMKLLLNVFAERAAETERARNPSQLAVQEYNKLPPEPRLQAAPGWGVTLSNGDINNLALKPPGAERVQLDQYWEQQLKGGKVDPKTDFTTLPIEQAMKQTVADGLPVRPEQQAAGPVSAQGMDAPSDWSSGRQPE